MSAPDTLSVVSSVGFEAWLKALPPERIEALQASADLSAMNDAVSEFLATGLPLEPEKPAAPSARVWVLNDSGEYVPTVEVLPPEDATKWTAGAEFVQAKDVMREGRMHRIFYRPDSPGRGYESVRG